VRTSGQMITTTETAMRKQYPSDLSDGQFALLEPHIPKAKHGGRKRTVDMRAVLDAIFYLTKTGCQWRYLPHDFPPKSTVYDYFAQWRADGTWDHFLRILATALRVEAAKETTPSLVIIDSQSVKTVGQAGEHSYDGNKKINGRKRHILVDTLGLLMAVVVTGAGVLDGAGAKQLLAEITKDKFPRLKKVLGDAAYSKCELPIWIAKNGFYELWIKDREAGGGFRVIQWRWIVERTFAWLGRYRRNSKDYEVLTESSEAMIRISSIHRMLNKLKPNKSDRPFTYRKKSA
jgi:putative transposase